MGGGETAGGIGLKVFLVSMFAGIGRLGVQALRRQCGGEPGRAAGRLAAARSELSSRRGGLPPTTGGRVWSAGSAAPYSPTNGSARSEPTRRCEGPRAQPAARSPATSSSQTPRQRPVVGAAAERTGRRVPRTAASPGEQRTQLHRRLTPCDTGLASRNSDRTIGLHLMVPCPARIALAFTKSRSRETAMLFRARIDQAASLANCPSPRREWDLHGPE